VLVIVVDLTIPTGFSPNSDLVNDQFVIPELALYDATLKVWNRWGELVYENEHYVNDWNGTCLSDTCLGSGTVPDGTYFYMIDVHGVTFKGYITIKK
jgi:gliding motility-associated-like protein